MKVFLNPGHDRDYDSGAVNPNNGARECDVAYRIGKRVKGYLEAVGIQVRMLQSDNLDWDSRYDDRQDTCVCDEANNWPADGHHNENPNPDYPTATSLPECQLPQDNL
jgi:N-acetylmuramoyl-L-alanine amidase